MTLKMVLFKAKLKALKNVSSRGRPRDSRRVKYKAFKKARVNDLLRDLNMAISKGKLEPF
jgi:hypothetical protein